MAIRVIIAIFLPLMTGCITLPERDETSAPGPNAAGKDGEDKKSVGEIEDEIEKARRDLERVKKEKELERLKKELEREKSENDLGKKIRLAAFGTAIPMLATPAIDSSGSGDWTDFFQMGVGGGIEFAYQPCPALRFGIGGGFHIFQGLNDETGNPPVTVTKYQYGDIQCIALGLDGTFCMPFGTPFDSWFRAGQEFSPGPVAYAGMELAGVFRPRVKSKVRVIPPGIATWEEMFEQSFTGFFGIRVGFEYRLGNFAPFLDFGYRLYTPPLEGKDLSASALAMHTFPIRFGIAIYL